MFRHKLSLSQTVFLISLASVWEQCREAKNPHWHQSRYCKQTFSHPWKKLGRVLRKLWSTIYNIRQFPLRWRVLEIRFWNKKSFKERANINWGWKSCRVADLYSLVCIRQLRTVHITAKQTHTLSYMLTVHLPVIGLCCSNGAIARGVHEVRFNLHRSACTYGPIAGRLQNGAALFEYISLQPIYRGQVYDKQYSIEVKPGQVA